MEQSLLNLKEKASIDFILNIMSHQITNAYHYTNTAGLEGILRSNELWLTESKFLNDPYEIQHGINIAHSESLKEAIRLMKNDNSDRHRIDAITLISKNIDKFKESIYSTLTFVMSFCEDGDLLSQWKGYSDFGKGFSIGFNALSLSQINNFTLGKVIYEDNKKIEILKNLIKIYTSAPKQIIENEEDKFLISFFNMVKLASNFFKSDYFKEENEWRLVSSFDITGDPFENNYKMTDLGLTPFIIVNLSPIIDKIDKIIIGPKMNYNLNRFSLSKIISVNKIEKSKGNIQ